MGTSLAKGAAWLIEQGADCAVIGLADMPWIRSETIAAVTEEGLHGGRAVAPAFEGRPGRDFRALCRPRCSPGCCR